MQRVKPYILRQAKSLQPKQGYILLEVLLICVLLAGLSTAAVSYGHNWQQGTRKLAVRLATDILVADIRKLQENAMFYTNKSCNLKVSSTKDTYGIYENLKVIRSVSFPKLGYGDVYFANALPSIQFSSLGVPSSSSSTSYILRHRQLSNFSCIVKIEAVTGRVSINEGK